MRVHTLAITIGAAALLATACGSNGSGSGSSSGGSSKPTLTITSPTGGATVTTPFTLTFTTSVPIGPTDSGKDHVHLFIDGKTQNYKVVTSTRHRHRQRRRRRNAEQQLKPQRLWLLIIVGSEPSPLILWSGIGARRAGSTRGPMSACLS